MCVRYGRRACPLGDLAVGGAASGVCRSSSCGGGVGVVVCRHRHHRRETPSDERFEPSRERGSGAWPSTRIAPEFTRAEAPQKECGVPHNSGSSSSSAAPLLLAAGSQPHACYTPSWSWRTHSAQRPSLSVRGINWPARGAPTPTAEHTTTIHAGSMSMWTGPAYHTNIHTRSQTPNRQIGQERARHANMTTPCPLEIGSQDRACLTLTGSMFGH